MGGRHAGCRVLIIISVGIAAAGAAATPHHRSLRLAHDEFMVKRRRRRFERASICFIFAARIPIISVPLVREAMMSRLRILLTSTKADMA